jgi:hypothetical protein
LERQEDKKERDSGEEDKRIFNSEKRLASKGRRTVRWREGGGEQKPKEAQKPIRSRGKEEVGGREASKEETESDWGVERKVTGTCTSKPIGPSLPFASFA